MTNQVPELFSKVLELKKARGFAPKEFFDRLLSLVWEATQEDLQAVEPILHELSQPSGFRAPNEREADGMVYMLHGVVKRRIKDLAHEQIEIEPGSLEHRALEAISRGAFDNITAPDLAGYLSIELVSELEDFLLGLERAGLVYWTRSPSIVMLTDDGYKELSRLSEQTPDRA